MMKNDPWMTATAVISTLAFLSTLTFARADTYTGFKLNGVTFDDGATATGTFVLNSTTNQLLNVDIVTSTSSGPSAFLGQTFISGAFGIGPIIPDVDEFSFPADGGGELGLAVLNYPSLSSPTPLFTSVDGRSHEIAGFPISFDDERFVVSGELVPTTPLPPALPLFLTGLGALGLMGWRRKPNSTHLLDRSSV